MLKNLKSVSLILLAGSLCFCGNMYAAAGSKNADVNITQQKTKVKGFIEDSFGPVTGAAIAVKGTSFGTISDVNGEFTVDIVKGETIVISFIGYVTQEIVYTGQSEIKVNLQEDTKKLDEVVVVGFATVKKANLTGAVSAIDSKILEDRPIMNLGQGLQGAVSNLNITVSGRPGEGSSFNIRGNASLSGGKPLILVDGVEMDPNLINPQDVKSVSVLKDAASAAIYGSRAAYGVMLITTKGGKKDQPLKITFDGSYSFNEPTTRPTYMNSLEYANWMNAASQTTNNRDYFDGEWMGHIRNYYNDPANNSPVFVHSDPNISNFGRKYSYAGNTDWMKELYKTTYPIQKYNIAINGGSKNVTYYTSAGYTDQGSLIRFGNEQFRKFNVMNNISYDIRKWLNVSMKTTYNRTELAGLNQDNVHGSAFLGGDSRPIMPIKHPDGNWAGQGDFTNFPAILEEGGSRSTKKNDFWNTFTAKITPLEGLSINFDYTFNFYSEVNKFHMKSFNEYGADGQFLQVFSWSKPNSVAMSEVDDTYNAVNLFADYEKTLGKHYMKVLVGFNQDEKSNRSFSASRNNLISNDIPSMGNATGEKSVSNGQNSWSVRGTFLRLNYGFDERYLLELNGRYDLSSRFPKHDRTVFNPSISAAWRISNEKFFEGAKSLIDELKIRGSYGSLGNQSIDAYQPYLSNFGTGTLGWIMGTQQNQYVTPGGLVSSSLTWETATQYDLGLDFTMLSGRLKGAFDYYQRTTSDILMKGKELPAIIGTDEPMENAAAVRTNGWEFEVSWNDRLANGLVYSFGFNISDYQATVTKFDNPTGKFDDHYVGKKLGEIWGYQTLGLFQSQEEIDAAPDHSLLNAKQPLVGDLRFANRDGRTDVIDWGDNTLSNPGDQYIIGNNTPRYQYGIKASAEWKNFDLNLFFQGVGKRDLNLPSMMFLSHYSSEWSVPSGLNADYWSETNRNAFFPRPRFDGGGWTGQSQTRFMQNAAYCRLKSLTIGYSVPKSILSKISVDRLRIYLAGENLFTIKNTPEGFDPELDDPYKYPLQRSFSLGLNLTF